MGRPIKQFGVWIAAHVTLANAALKRAVFVSVKWFKPTNETKKGFLQINAL
jgi:hypothetical protein